MIIEKTFKIEVAEDTKYCGKNCEHYKDGWCKLYKDNIIKYYNDDTSEDMGRSEMCFRNFGARPVEKEEG